MEYLRFGLIAKNILIEDKRIYDLNIVFHHDSLGRGLLFFQIHLCWL